jgi:hypothetical protein
MEMRSLAVQLSHAVWDNELYPFEDMLCQMMDMIKPHNANFLVAEDFAGMPSHRERVLTFFNSTVLCLNNVICLSNAKKVRGRV